MLLFIYTVKFLYSWKRHPLYKYQTKSKEDDSICLFNLDHFKQGKDQGGNEIGVLLLIRFVSTVITTLVSITHCFSGPEMNCY